MPHPPPPLRPYMVGLNLDFSLKCIDLQIRLITNRMDLEEDGKTIVSMLFLRKGRKWQKTGRAAQQLVDLTIVTLVVPLCPAQMGFTEMDNRRQRFSLREKEPKMGC